MKKIILLITIIITSIGSFAQLNPVKWTFTVKKIADKNYEVHIKATIQNGWHLYSQVQPEDAIANPTEFTINNNPLITLSGKIREVGSIEKYHDAKLGISANQFSNSVDFIQLVKLKTKAKTNITGSVEYQTCDDKKCLPPKTVNFSVAIQ